MLAITLSLVEAIRETVSDFSHIFINICNIVSQYMKSDISLSHSIIEVEYDQNQGTTPKDATKPILDTSADD